jgi:heme/copper-type cytochrome/quinol oxidase subunit 3
MITAPVAQYTHPLHGFAEVFWLLVGFAIVLGLIFLTTLARSRGRDGQRRRNHWGLLGLLWHVLTGRGRRLARKEPPPPPPDYRDRY